MSPVQAAIERTVIGMGYELVDVEFAGGGLLRVYIDLPSAAYAADAPLAADGLPPSVKVEDCERVSHQLSHVLTVENIDYARLEVSSPGMDRPLKRAADFERFVGHEVTVRLRQPLSGRRNFSGVLVHDDAPAEGGDAALPGHWVLELSDAAPSRAASGKGKAGAGKAGVGKAGTGKSGGGAKGPAAPKAAKAAGRPGAAGDTQEQEAASAAATDTPQPDSGVETVRRLTFTLDEIERARLVPRYKF